MKISLNNCPKCCGVVEFDDLTFFGAKHYCGKCTVCRLRGEYAITKTLASELWNNGSILYDEHEINRRLISMCENEIQRFNTKNEIDIKYVEKLKDMIKYFNR